MTEVEETARGVYRNAVDENFGVPALSTAKKERGYRSVRAALHERSTGHFAERIRDSGDTSCAEIIAGYHGDSLCECARGSRNLRPRHDDGSELLCCVLHLAPHRCRRGTERDRRQPERKKIFHVEASCDDGRGRERFRHSVASSVVQAP